MRSSAATRPGPGTAVFLAAGLLVAASTTGAAHAAAAPFPHCYGHQGRGSYTQTGMLPGLGKATWTFSVNFDGNDQCVDTDAGEITVTDATRRNAGPAGIGTDVTNVEFTTDRKHWTGLADKPRCGDGVCLYNDSNAHVGQHTSIRQFRQTSRLVHNGSRSLPVTFTCDLDNGKCATTGPGTARPGNGCFDEQLCLYPQPDWNGQPLVLNPADIHNQGKCIRRTVRSYIDSDATESGVGQADGTTKSYVTHLHVYDNPDCSTAAPHRSKALAPPSADHALTAGGSGATVASIKITNDEVGNTRH